MIKKSGDVLQLKTLFLQSNKEQPKKTPTALKYENILEISMLAC